MEHILFVEAYKKNYFDSAIADVFRAIRGKCLLGSFTLLFCIIDSLATIEYGKKEKSFNKWINRWLLPLNIHYTTKEEFLFAARCSLIHSLGVSDAQKKQNISIQFAHRAAGSHLIVINQTFVLNLPEFIAEISLATFQFFDYLKNENEDSLLLQRMQTLMKLHFPVNASPGQLQHIISKSYRSMDKTMAVFDRQKSPDIEDVRLKILLLKIFRGF